jgi:hypothetical protein
MARCGKCGYSGAVVRRRNGQRIRKCYKCGETALLRPEDVKIVECVYMGTEDRKDRCPACRSLKTYVGKRQSCKCYNCGHTWSCREAA